MAAKTLYFRNLQGGAPTGSWELREVFPTGAEDATSAHDSCADCSGAVKSVVIKPGASNGTFVSGLPETNAPPDTGDQFGWFTSGTYSGTFAAGNWTFQYRHDDNRTQVTGHPVFNVYKTTLESFGGTWTFLFQTESPNDWWTGTTSTQSHTVDPGAISVDGNFLFVNVWCHEHTNQSARIHHFRVEGSALAESTVSKIVTTDLQPAENDINKVHTELPQLDTTYVFLAHSFQGWQEAPLSADLPPESDQETIARRHYDLPVWNIKYLGHSFDGWFQQPTPDDIEDPILGDETQATKVPWARDKHIYDGFQLAPLSEDFTEEASTRIHTDLPPWAVDRHNYDGFQLAPTSDDSFVESVHSYIAVPCYVRVNRDYTFTFPAVPDEAAEELLPQAVTSLAPIVRNRHSYDGFQAAPLSADEEEILAGSVMDLPAWVQDRTSYDGFQAAPLSEDAAADEPLSQAVTDLAPVSLDRHDYGGFSLQPTPDNAAAGVENVYNLATTGIGL